MVKVAVGLSGGIDSSTSAIVLQEQGYDVIGVTMRLWSECITSREGSCCGPQDHLNLKLIANDKGFPHYLYTLTDQFYNDVVKYYINSFKNGETPSPCTICNSHCKWHYMWEFAKKLGCEKIATGHYARIEQVNDFYMLKTSYDLKKDQTFFLWQMTQEQLSNTIFPIGGMTKPYVRNIGKDSNLPNWNKKESMDVCFISDGNSNFLKRHLPDYCNPGNVLDLDGNIIGRHKGAVLYTIGQSQRLEIFKPVKMFVIKIDVINNVLVVGPRESLLTDTINIERPNWISPIIPTAGWVRVRHGGTLHKCTINGNIITLVNDKIVKANKGQTAVIYSDELTDGSRHCLGGGWIV